MGKEMILALALALAPALAGCASAPPPLAGDFCDIYEFIWIEESTWDFLAEHDRFTLENIDINNANFEDQCGIEGEE